MSTDKTLADVQPGGMVRLGHQAERARFEEFLSRNPLTALCAGTAWEVWQAALSAQPSPGGQGDAVHCGKCKGRGYVHVDVDVDDSGGSIGNIESCPHCALAARQPVGEPVAWMTHHDEPMLFPTAAEAAAYCEDDEQPVPLFRSPAQAVDLGQFRPAVELMEWQERGHANPDFPVGDPKKHAEALRLLALIDSRACK